MEVGVNIKQRGIQETTRNNKYRTKNYTNTAMSLILGMEDIMTYIKNQDLRVKKLEEENKQLKEQVALAEAGQEEEATLSCRLLEENKALKERMSIMEATASTHIQDINEVHQDYGDMVRKLKDQTVYLEAEVCRYSNAIEEEYVLKTDYEELKEEVLVEKKKTENLVNWLAGQYDGEESVKNSIKEYYNKDFILNGHENDWCECGLEFTEDDFKEEKEK